MFMHDHEAREKARAEGGDAADDENLTKVEKSTK